MKYTNFKNYVHYRLGCTIGRNYDSYEELIDHLESGNITIPITLAIQLQQDFETQKAKVHEYFSPEEIEEIKKEEEARVKEINRQKEIEELSSYIDSVLSGASTGSATLDFITR